MPGELMEDARLRQAVVDDNACSRTNAAARPSALSASSSNAAKAWKT